MEVIINMESYNESKLMTPEEKEFYRQTVYSLYEQLKSTMDLSLLESIIVTENYIEELFEFQRNNGLAEFVTDNEYGQGAAQVVSVVNDNGEQRHTILMKKELVMAILPDDVMANIKKTMDEDNYKTLMHLRQSAINTLYHEFSHVYEYNLRENINWMIKQTKGNSLETQYLSLALSIWQEYFACRNSALSFDIVEEDFDEMLNTCLNAEMNLRDMRKRYNCREVSLDSFVTEFHKYTNFILKKMASAYGNFYCFRGTREKMVGILKDYILDTYIGVVWDELGESLDELFETFPNWESKEVMSPLVSVIQKYIELFEIYIKDTPKGIYYDIPVRL